MSLHSGPEFIVPADLFWHKLMKLRDGFWRRIMPSSGWVVLVGCIALTAYSTVELASDPSGESVDKGALLLVFPGAPVAVWAVLASLWGRDKDLGILDLAGIRAVVIPVLTVPVLLVTNFVVRLLPAVKEPIRADPYHYWFGETPQFLVVMVGLVGSLIAALVVFAFVVWPIGTILRPDQVTADLALDTSPEKRRHNRVAMRAIGLGVPLTFVVAVLLLAAADRVLPLWPFLVSSGVLLALAILFWFFRRVDHEERARWGPRLRGLPNPWDKPPNPWDRPPTDDGRP